MFSHYFAHYAFDRDSDAWQIGFRDFPEWQTACYKREDIELEAQESLLAAIAASLMKLAFGGGSEAPAADLLEPSMELSEPHIPVERATITNTVSIDAVIRSEAPVEVKATSASDFDRRTPCRPVRTEPLATMTRS